MAQPRYEPVGKAHNCGPDATLGVALLPHLHAQLARCAPPVPHDRLVASRPGVLAAGHLVHSLPFPLLLLSHPSGKICRILQSFSTIILSPRAWVRLYYPQTAHTRNADAA